MTFQIERGIPLPDAWPAFIKTLRAMQTGDSFLVEDPGLCTPNTIYAVARRESIRVSVRQMDGGLRVWRVDERQHMDTASTVVRARKDLKFRMNLMRSAPAA